MTDLFLDLEDQDTENSESTEVIDTGASRFITKLKQRFGADLGFENPDEKRSFIAKAQGFYFAVKDAHRGQVRKTGEKYFDNHIHGVVDITLSFPNATLWDAIVALGHDFVEDHRELTYDQACSHIFTTFGPVRGPPLVASIKRLTKQDIEFYLDPDLAAIVKKLPPAEKAKFFEQNKIFGLLRGKKYFDDLEINGTEGEIRAKTADSIHNLNSCHTLGEEKIRKTLSEKEDYLLPILKQRNMPHEQKALEIAISETKLVLLNGDTKNAVGDTLTSY